VQKDNKFLNNYKRELEQNKMQIGLTPEEANKYYLDDEYSLYFVEYIGDFLTRVNATDYAKAFMINAFFAVVFVKDGMLSEFLKNFPEIVNIERNFPFTLSDLNQSGELPDLKAISKGNVSLDGEGIIIAIVGTGIDYLNPRFMDENGETRIVSIWDQTLTRGPFPSTHIYGTEFTREEINKAIQSNIAGKNPYAIVEHKDEDGYGTAIAGIIGARSIEKDNMEASVAPKCEFAIVKLKTSRSLNLRHWGLEEYRGIVYDSNDIVAAGRYLYQLQQRFNKPVVMYLPIGTNLGAHDGGTIGERFVDFFTQGRKFSVVTSTGNQGGSPIRYQGKFLAEESENEININVDEQQGNIFFSLYFKEPDRINVGITSPSGERIDKLDIKYINGEEINTTLGKSSIYVQYFLQPKSINNQRLDFVIKNAIGGVWKIKIMKDYIIYGDYNLWFQQEEFSVGNTGFLQPAPYTTLMTPSTATNIIVTSSYDQIDNITMKESGRGFTIDNRIIPSVALPARNVFTTGLNNIPVVATGSAVSGAILAGVVALLFQWGIVNNNDNNMYASKIKSYLIQGTVREQGKVYPNQETGFGVLNIEKLFSNLTPREYNEDIAKSQFDRTLIESKQNIFVNIPKELYDGLKYKEQLILNKDFM